MDDERLDLEKMVAIMKQIEGVEMVFATQSSEEAYREIKKHEIIFIERTGRTTTIVTTGEKYTTYQTLDELEK